MGFGDHHFLLRPCESFDQRLRRFKLSVTPEPQLLRWRHDPHGNAVGLARFATVADTLAFRMEAEVEQSLTTITDLGRLETSARRLPPAYARDEAPDLAAFRTPRPGPDDAAARFAADLLRREAPADSVIFLALLTQAIRAALRYERRDERGIRAPAETLSLGRGTCRDYAMLWVAAARAQGFAARYVSGYVANRADGSQATGGATHESREMVGGGATHAWAQAYLPGGGWVDFDPTNGIVGNAGLVRVACVREPGHAVPLWGTWTGEAGASLGMEVAVAVTRAPAEAVPAARETG